MRATTLRAVFLLVFAIALGGVAGVPGCATKIDAPTAVVAAVNGSIAVGSTVQLDGSKSSDPTKRALYFQWAFVELPMGSAAELRAATTAKPYFDADRQGSYRVSLIVSNGAVTSDPAIVTITVGTCGTNLPVVAAISATPAAPNVAQPVALTAMVTDADVAAPCNLPRALSYAWSLTKSPGGSKATLGLPTSLTPSFVPDVAGVYEVALVVTDDLGRAGVQKTLDVTVATCGGNPPVVTTIMPSTAAPAVGQTVQLTPTITDADTAMGCGLVETFSYAWSIVSLPIGSQASLNAPTAFGPSFKPDIPGAYEIALVVTDAQNLKSAQQSTIVTASACGSNAPVVGQMTATPANPNTGQVVQLAGPVTDADDAAPCNLNQAITLAWSFSAVPAGSKAVIQTPTSGTPWFQPDLPGIYTVALTATDSTGLSGAGTLSITAGTCGSSSPVALVTELAPAPAAGVQPAAAFTAADVAPGTVVQVTGAPSTDADLACNATETLAYGWKFLSVPLGGSVALNSPNIQDPTFTAAVAGTYVLGLTVTDSLGHVSGQATFTITANPLSGIAVPGGFSIVTVAAGGTIAGPRGITEDGSKNIYVAQSNARITRIDAATSAVTTLTSAGFLVGGCQDVTFDANKTLFWVSNGANQILQVSLAGVQTPCIAGNNGNDSYRGLFLYSGTGGPRLLAANHGQRRIDFFDPTAACPGMGMVLTSNDFNNGAMQPPPGLLSGPWGVTAANIAGVDDAFTSDDVNSNVFRNVGGSYTTNGGVTNTKISGGGLLNTPRAVVVTPAACPTQKLLVASAGNGQILIYSNQQNAAGGLVISGMQRPVGIYIESLTSMLLTDETLNAVFRVTGPICSL